jgi:hypothetical protein|tara:strand:- start:86 stop:229 length:144 start_codon:yes stop_codon:yes gene_type:complete
MDRIGLEGPGREVGRSSKLPIKIIFTRAERQGKARKGAARVGVARLS